MAKTEFFVDYDGTITSKDAFDVLTRAFGDDVIWKAIEGKLERGEITIRDALRLEAATLTLTFDEAVAFLREAAPFDPSFVDFADWCRARGSQVTVVSSGVGQLIERTLRRHGLEEIPIIANSVTRDERGVWRMTFRDDVPNGTDKAAVVEAARARGKRTVFIGDGRSDYDAALAADVRFAKRGEHLARFLQEKKVDFSTFSSFHEIVSRLAWEPV